jgi:predicted aminopeptidase
VNAAAASGNPARSPATRHLLPVDKLLRTTLLVPMLAWAAVIFAGCAGPGYYLQATSGHWQLMRARQDVAGILASPDSDPALVRKLRLAAGILEFAGTELGLPRSDSYAEFVATGRDAVAWNVVATPEFSLAPRAWCFPVAGCVPYRAYFDPEKARRAADRLAAKGMDVAVSPVTAYSTLGWFDDPLLDTMLNGPETRLAATLFHELAHRRLYLKGQTAFSESYARFVENAGVKAWLRSTGRTEDLHEWGNFMHASAAFNELLQQYRDRLASLYATDTAASEKRADKAGILSDLASSYTGLRDTGWQGRDYFAGFFSHPVNNAHLALVASYEAGQCAFSNLFREAGGDFREFHRLAEVRAGSGADGLADWLAQGCADIAPKHNL